MTTEWPIRLLAAVDEMTRPRRQWVHAEGWDAASLAQTPPVRIWRRERYEIEARSLLDQLHADVDADEDSSPKHGAASNATGYESKAPGRYAPRELLASMAREVAIWVDWCGLDVRGDQHHRDSHGQIHLTQHALDANLGQLVGIAQKLNDDGWQAELEQMTRDCEKIAAALRRYCGLERIFRPRAYCPNPDCPNAHRSDHDVLAAYIARHIDIRRPRPSSSLIVWLDEEGGRAQKAVCQQCGRTWDETTVGLVLDHIRTNTDRPRRSALAGYQRLARTLRHAA